MSKHKRDYYELLGVSRTASADDIRQAYRRLAREHHPDVSDSEDAAERFAEIGEAYAVLSDEEKRRAYDRLGHAGVGAGAAGRPGAGAWSDFGGAQVDAADFGSIFEELMGRGRGSPFGGRGPAGTGPAGATAPAAGPDLEHGVSVSFLTAARGGTERLRLNRGTGETETIDVRIPAGIESGAKLRIRGKGHPGGPGAPAGDLIATVQVGRHPVFRRDGLDLQVDVPVTVAEAAFGAAVRVPLLDGSAEVKVPSGTSSGTKLRLKGKGITDAGGASGDYYAVVQIAAPAPMNDRVRRLIEELGEELKNPRDSAPWADDDPGPA